MPQSIEEIILRAEQAQRDHQPPNTLSALAAMVNPEYHGKRISTKVIQEMKALARQRDCTALIVPIRPTWKSRYPLTPMERYVTWTRSDGAPLDPWLRVHWRLDAQPLCIAPNTLTVEGTIKEWESWTDMAFPESGSYVVPGALQPVEIDCEQNLGRYEDPNYWFKHLEESSKDCSINAKNMSLLGNDKLEIGKKERCNSPLQLMCILPLLCFLNTNQKKFKKRHNLIRSVLAI